MQNRQPDDDTQEGRSYSVRAVERVCDILDLLLSQAKEVSLAELADAVALPRSSVFRYLWTLEQRGYVERGSNSRSYSLGGRFLRIRARQAEVLAQRVRPHLERLREEFDETVNLGMLDAGRVIYLDILESSKMVRLAARVGGKDPIHCTALGKAIAADLSEETVRGILATQGMPRFTPTTITTIAGYLRELEGVRSRGYAIDNGENESDGFCVAVSLPGTELNAGISLSAPASRFVAQNVDQVAAALTQVARSLATVADSPEHSAPHSS